jgi:hypothetical protein
MRAARHALVAAIVALLFAQAAAQETAAVFQGEPAEQLLAKGRIQRVGAIAQGVTGPQRATLQFEGATHDAVYKNIEFMRPGVTQLDDGTVIFNMEDNWRFEVAAYQIDRMVGLGMVPATVEREYRGRPGSLQWWVESEMSEAERRRRNAQAPDAEDWSRQQIKMQMFDNLLYNWDRHMNNILITKDFQLRLIDHSRAFLSYDDLRRNHQLTRFSRSLLDGFEKLALPDLKKRVGRHIEEGKLNALLKRRDKIVALAKSLVAEKGEAAVLFP